MVRIGALHRRGCDATELTGGTPTPQAHQNWQGTARSLGENSAARRGGHITVRAGQDTTQRQETAASPAEVMSSRSATSRPQPVPERFGLPFVRAAALGRRSRPSGRPTAKRHSA